MADSGSFSRLSRSVFRHIFRMDGSLKGIISISCSYTIYTIIYIYIHLIYIYVGIYENQLYTVYGLFFLKQLYSEAFSQAIQLYVYVGLLWDEPTYNWIDWEIHKQHLRMRVTYPSKNNKTLWKTMVQLHGLPCGMVIRPIALIEPLRSGYAIQPFLPWHL